MWYRPHDTCVIGMSASASTTVGVSRSDVSPRPSLFDSPVPQMYRRPALAEAEVEKRRLAIEERGKMRRIICREESGAGARSR